MSDTPTIATLFSGGEGVGVGAKMAGVFHAWGIEHDDDIANVARSNGFNVLTADVTRCDPHDFESVSLLHASPPCPNFSVAKAGAAEQEEDVALARATVHFIEVLRPELFTLENVYLYRKSQSWRLIRQTLKRLGYGCKFWHLNSADYGVPQTRKRMIVVARRDGQIPQPPRATHAHPDDLSPMFDERKPWVGWYEAIEDLIPTLPDSEFAPWQLERLPDELKTSLLDAKNSRRFFNGEHKPQPITQRQVKEPAWTLQAQTSPADFRAFIVGQNTNDTSGTSIYTTSGMPVGTVHTGQNHIPRAFLVKNGDNWSNIPMSTEPSYTIPSSNSGLARAHCQGRVVQMTPRALARFQSFPDWYELPDTKKLACRVIGNAVPPLLYEKLVRQLLIKEE